MSYKNTIGLLGQSFFVFGIAAALGAGTVSAQNPYYSAAANSQVAAYGSATSEPTSAYGNPSALPAASQTSAYGSASSASPAAATASPASAASAPNGSYYGGAPDKSYSSSRTDGLNPYASASGNTGSTPSVYGNTGSTSGSTGSAPSVYGNTVPAAASPAVGQAVYAPYESSEVVYESAPSYGAGFSTMPDYPRNEPSNVSAPVTPEPSDTYPQTQEEMMPERIRRDPPLAPYAQQEAYSYTTETGTSESSACQICNEGYGNPYLWQLGAAAKIKHRARQDKTDPVFYNSAGTYTVDSGISFPVSAGIDLNATRYLGRNAFNFDIWADLRFNGLYEWENEKSVTAADTIYSTYGIAGLSTVEYDVTIPAAEEGGEATTDTYTSYLSQMHMKYKAEMNSAEMMFQFRKRGRPDPLIGHPNGTWTRECQGGPRYTHLVGLHYTSYNEDLNWTGLSSIYNKSKEYVGTESGYLNLETKNNLLGLSLGGEFVDKHCVWAWGMNWRLTPCLNFMEAQMHLQNDQKVNYMAKLSETDIAYIAEWGIFTTYKTGKHVVWRLGYDVSCLGNLALAGQNLTIGDSIGNNNYNIVQEVTLGCTFVW